ncbi:nucleotide exchange factor GrpE [Actinoalloteichus sp. AHMU CJ021]|uniref:Protein GrpE n=1 Tax=Actinoalloteichus caeruleus DSM 43889 TaxID=1120930 RepID=A0ABT1JKT7_ACTCY|nr:nucleotide exchange factor GrpE [Actinoalloteichus caeruleus]AUS78921.1 nucleotide exchange factor GrpE [Actinoalloteichus sp. AHMU CJ021]MCP2333128.1 molecular chaperone GrpE [Actinoalloteichus caeruleus DSM 43889]
MSAQGQELPDRENGDEQPRVVIRDRRRIDPETGEARDPDAESNGGRHRAEPSPEEPSAPQEDEPVVIEADAVETAPEDAPVAETEAAAPSELEQQLAERTADLQRLSAEYANYRRRVERDREATINSAKAALATDLLVVLDDLERAAAHGDLTGPFKAVGDKVVETLTKAGLEPYGAEGDPFDPSVHEAVQHDTSPDVSEPTVTTVLRRGYRFGDRVLRAPLVGVTDHDPSGTPTPVADEGSSNGDQAERDA